MAPVLPEIIPEMTETKWLIIVRRGATEQFERLKAQFADDPNTTVRFDRRIGPRRPRRQDPTARRPREERRLPEDPRLLIDGWFMAPALPSRYLEEEMAEAESGR